MPIREFTDLGGTKWTVWRVVPSGRYITTPVIERRKQQVPYSGPDRRRRGVILDPGLEEGWLCFESNEDKRRLVPPPNDWEHCSEGRLLEYFRLATPVRNRGTPEE